MDVARELRAKSWNRGDGADDRIVEVHQAEVLGVTIYLLDRMAVDARLGSGAQEEAEACMFRRVPIGVCQHIP